MINFPKTEIVYMQFEPHFIKQALLQDWKEPLEVINSCCKSAVFRGLWKFFDIGMMIFYFLLIYYIYNI